MSLPISPRRRKGSKSRSGGEDIALTGWAIIVARVAWTLNYRDIPLQEILLRAAVNHAIMNIKPDTDLVTAEDLSEHYVHQLINRFQRIDSKPQYPQDIHITLKESWRHALHAGLSQLELGVFRYHYGNRYSINECGVRLSCDSYAIPAVQESIREKMVTIATSDHFPMDAWPDERVDSYLYRLVGVPPEPCPTNLEAVHQDNHQHRKICCRCDRVARLLLEDRITPIDLVPPPFGARPLNTATILAIQLKEESKHHRVLLEKEKGIETFTAAPDLLLFDFEEPERVQKLLKLATELGKPTRNHLRGVVLKGDGKWTDAGLIGPLANEALERMASARWGVVEQVTDLAHTHDTPPSSLRAWAAAAAVLLLALSTLWMAFAPASLEPIYPIDAEYIEGSGGVWVLFDVDDAALVTIFVQNDEELMPILHSSDPSEKMPLSTGDGHFSFHRDTDAVLIVSSDESIYLSQTVLSELSVKAGIESLSKQIADRYPTSDQSLYQR